MQRKINKKIGRNVLAQSWVDAEYSGLFKLISVSSVVNMSFSSDNRFHPAIGQHVRMFVAVVAGMAAYPEPFDLMPLRQLIELFP